MVVVVVVRNLPKRRATLTSIYSTVRSDGRGGHQLRGLRGATGRLVPARISEKEALDLDRLRVPELCPPRRLKEAAAA